MRQRQRAQSWRVSRMGKYLQWDRCLHQSCPWLGGGQGCVPEDSQLEPVRSLSSLSGVGGNVLWAPLRDRSHGPNATRTDMSTMCLNSAIVCVSTVGPTLHSHLLDISEGPSSSSINFRKTMIGFKSASWRKNAFISSVTRADRSHSLSSCRAPCQALWKL